MRPGFKVGPDVRVAVHAPAPCPRLHAVFNRPEALMDCADGS